MPDHRIILVEARPVRRQRLASQLGALSQVELVTSCGTLMEAYTAIESEVPDLILISRAMTKAPEHAMLLALAQILDVAEVAIEDEADPAEIARICQSWRKRGSAADGLGKSKPSLRPSGALAGGEDHLVAPRPPRSELVRAPQAFILIGASTGGVEALHQILPQFPADCPPVIVVQHIRGAFSSAFADRLNRVCRAEVREAEDGALISPGQIVIAPGDQTHLQLSARQPLSVRLIAAGPVTGHRPSVDALFSSALPHAERVVAALLTGMGADGAQGLLALRRAGAQTIAQDRATSTVYGMPRVAAELGAVGRILPLGQIASAVLSAALVISQGMAAHPVASK